MDALQQAVVVPALEVVPHRATRGQVLGQCCPLAAGAEDVEDAVDHRAHVHHALLAAALGGRDQRPDQRPLRVGQITRIAQPAAVIAALVLVRPHAATPTSRAAAIGPQAPLRTQDIPGWTLRESCERLNGKTNVLTGMAGEVARLIMERAGEFPTMEDVAGLIGATTRALRRCLLKEGLSLSQIFDQVRCGLAEEYLASKDFTVEDIATLLGFTDAANFRRSFKRRTGKSPRDWTLDRSGVESQLQSSPPWAAGLRSGRS